MKLSFVFHVFNILLSFNDLFRYYQRCTVLRKAPTLVRSYLFGELLDMFKSFARVRVPLSFCVDKCRRLVVVLKLRRELVNWAGNYT